MSHAFFGPLKGREYRIPRSGDTQGVRMSHAFYRTAQGRLPKPMSSKRQDDILFKNQERCATFFFKSISKPSKIIIFYK